MIKIYKIKRISFFIKIEKVMNLFVKQDIEKTVAALSHLDKRIV